MPGKHPALVIAGMLLLPLLASAPSAASPMHSMKSGYDASKGQGSVEQIARRCRYDKRGRLRCRGVRYRTYRSYNYDPYAYYDYYPRSWGYYGHHHHHHHHGFGHGHGHHHHGHH